MAAVFVGIVYVLAAIFGSLATCATFVGILRHGPLRAFKKHRRDVPPSCLLDTTLGTHHYVLANGIRFHYVSAGDDSKPLLLLLHGFPEFWFCWRHQLKEFAKDYHVVAVDMRGYNETERPPNKNDYALDILLKDIAELVPALGHSTCTLVAHDWGAIVAWGVAAKHPQLVEKLVIMNCPQTSVFRKFVRTNPRQLLKSWYVFVFQLPWLPEFMLQLHDYMFLDGAFRKGGVHNETFFPPDLVEAYKYVLSKPGALTAAINYYRCMFTRPSKLPRGPLTMPILVIWGDNDVALDKKMADMHMSVGTNVVVKHIPNCSHWVQQDAADTVNQYMRDFLEL
ncbi:hypothetical protein EMCRGX_G019130 [Ephydatia muelleri]|eukprot:Em0011g874a